MWADPALAEHTGAHSSCTKGVIWGRKRCFSAPRYVCPYISLSSTPASWESFSLFMTLQLKSTNCSGRRNARIIIITQAEHHNQGEAWSCQHRKREVLGGRWATHRQLLVWSPMCAQGAGLGVWGGGGGPTKELNLITSYQWFATVSKSPSSTIKISPK